MFIKIDGIKGEAQDKAHVAEIDVLAWSWGGSQSGTAHVGGGQGSGKVNVQDLSFTKYVDSASCALFFKMCKGEHIKDASLVVRKAAGDKPLEYLKLKMEDIIVTNVSTGGSGGEDRLTENVSLNFSKFKMEYFVQDEKGVGKSAGEVGWDIAANTKA
jgi:type VI secretion system secreted protein Hcp